VDAERPIAPRSMRAMVLENPQANTIQLRDSDLHDAGAPGSGPKNRKRPAAPNSRAYPCLPHDRLVGTAVRRRRDEELGNGAAAVSKKTTAHFRNWPATGIAYAAPDMGLKNFWA